MLRVSVAICFVSIIVLVVGFATPQLTTAQEQDNTEWDTYTNDKFKFSIEYPAHDIDTDIHIEAGEILSLTLGRDYSTDEEYMGITISVFSTNISLSKAVDHDIEVRNQHGPIKIFEGPKFMNLDRDLSLGKAGLGKPCEVYTYSEYRETSIHRVVLCLHDDKIYTFDFKGKSILFYYDEEPYNHMINSIKFFD